MPRTLPPLRGFTVAPERRGSTFPLDMLRYDMCWPEGPGDCATIAGTIGAWPPEGVVQVRIVGVRSPTTNRWLSFGWKVLDPKGGPADAR